MSDFIDHNNDKYVFWINDPMVLFRDGNWYKIIPNSSMTRIELYNTLTRLFLYIGIISLLFGYIDLALICLIVIFMIVLLYFIIEPKTVIVKKTEPYHNLNNNYYDQEENDEIIGTDKEKNICQMPSLSNPMMNLTLADLMNNPDRPAACNIENEIVNDAINLKMDELGINESNQLFLGDRSAQRAFYTMPVTTAINDQTGFAKWLYPSIPTCKENQENCLLYEDLRTSRYNPWLDQPYPSAF